MEVASSQVNSVRESEPGYGQLFAVLMRRRFILLSVLVGTLGLAAIATFLTEPTYVSGMQLLVEPNYQSKRETQQKIGNDFSDINVEIDSATQINLMQSSILLRKAMKLLQTDYPDLDPNDSKSVAAFKKAVQVTQIVRKTGREDAPTKIFQVFYTDNDPEKTQDVLVAMQKVYQDYNLEQQKLRLEKGLAFVNQQLPQIKSQVEQSEAALKKFRQQQEVVDPDLQVKAKTDALYRIEQAQQENQVQLQDLRSRYINLQRQLALSPQEALVSSRLSQSTRYQSLLAEIQKTELTLAQRRTRFQDSTPFVQKLLEQRARQVDLLNTEVQRILGSTSRSPVQTGEGLLSKGQLGQLDVALVNQLVDAEVNLKAAQTRASSLASLAQQLRSELRRSPELLTQYGRLQPEVELNRETLKQLLKAQQDIALEIARGGFVWQLVENPELGEKVGPSLLKNLLLGAVVGLFLGGLAAFARESIDDAVHSSDDLKRQVPVPLLGMIPVMALQGDDDKSLLSLPFGKSRSLMPDIDQVIHWQPFREALDLLYQNIQLVNAANPVKLLVVTSALSGEGKSTLVMGLAISAARLHQRVLVIDADLRRPSLHKTLSLPNDRGLSTLLSSDAPLPQIIDTHHSNLRSNIAVLTAGPTPTDPAKLLSSQRMRDVMTTFEKSYDLVLLDAPPVLGMVDAILVASCCQGVLMVGRIGHVTRAELTQATTMLNQLNVIGIVANGVNVQTRNDEHYRDKSNQTIDK
jgi:capsular exopolysaccharide synthesis family protein